MQTVVVSNALTVVLYESIKELPAALYQTARQYEVMSAELGQTEEEQMGMLDRAHNYALAGKLPEFQEQLANYKLARYLTKQKFSGRAA